MTTNYTIEVCNILDKYEIPYTGYGISTNLDKWKTNKAALLNLLRKHPNWDEKSFAVIFKVTENREIDTVAIRQYRNDVLNLSYALEISSQQRRSFDYLLCAVTNSISDIIFSKTILSKSIIELLAQHDIKCSIGQKASRVINKICKKYSIDKHPDYNAKFAKLADSLNPLQIKKKALLSVHPGDYLEMSNKDNSWSSCHKLNGGEYSGGTLSYMNDETSMIFYTVDNGVTDEYHKAPKRNRVVFCYKDGVLLQSRLYPNNGNDDIKNTYRNIVQQAITTCLNVPNLWTLKKDSNIVKNYCQTYYGSLHYPDYLYNDNNANISLLKSINIDENNKLVIGHNSYCVKCSRNIAEKNNTGVICNDCYNSTICPDCNSQIDKRSAYYVDGEYYCSNCVAYCEYCANYTHNKTYSAINWSCNTITICEECYSAFVLCETCNRLMHHSYIKRINNICYCHECIKTHQLQEHENHIEANEHIDRNNEITSTPRSYALVG